VADIKQEIRAKLERAGLSPKSIVLAPKDQSAAKKADVDKGTKLEVVKKKEAARKRDLEIARKRDVEGDRRRKELAARVAKTNKEEGFTEQESD
jgi:hypothetical protein